SIVVTATNNQTVTLYTFQFEAHFYYSSSLKFFVAANSVVCFLSVSLLLFNLLRRRQQTHQLKDYYFFLFLFDLVMTVLLIAGYAATNDQVLTMYEQWLVKHGKNYNALGEKETRFEIFKDNLKFINEHNSQNLSFRLGLNRFADLTNEEYRTRFLGTRIDPNQRMKKGKSNSQTNRYATRV
ncbi:hypothetical protein RYX36_016597, partial [Vicia faba]